MSVNYLFFGQPRWGYTFIFLPILPDESGGYVKWTPLAFWFYLMQIHFNLIRFLTLEEYSVHNPRCNRGKAVRLWPELRRRSPSPSFFFIVLVNSYGVVESLLLLHPPDKSGGYVLETPLGMQTRFVSSSPSCTGGYAKWTPLAFCVYAHIHFNISTHFISSLSPL